MRNPWILLLFAFASGIASVNGEDGFAGQSVNTDGTSYMRARYYDPETGSFLVKDPMGVTAGPNAYLYVGDNPINSIDPLGLFSSWDYFVNYSGEALGSISVVGGGGLGLVGTGTVEVFGIGVPVAYAGGYLAVQGSAVTYSSYKNVQYMNAHPTEDHVPLNASGLAGLAVSSLAQANGVQDSSSYFNGNAWGVANSGALAFDGLTTLGVGSLGAEANAASKAWVPTTASAAVLRKTYPTPDIAPILGLDPVSDALGKAGLGISFLDAGKSGLDALGQAAGGGENGSISTPNGSITTPLDSSLLFPQNGSLDLGNGYSIELGNGLSVGGVLINKAATLVGTNLSSIQGATYDPISKQVVFLGSSGFNATTAINMDYFYTAVQAVYGSAAPPFVSLNFPATPKTPWTDYGNGDGTFENGEINGFIMRYNPLWANEDTTIDVPVIGNWNGTNYNFTLHFQAYQLGTSVGGRPGMGLLYTGATNMPSGLTLNNSSLFTTGQTPSDFSLTATSQDGSWPVQLYNNTGHSFNITGFAVIPARQHRQYGGRVDGTRLGWVMYEADRVMKCLAVGKDNLTGATYSSSTVGVTGYQNMLERDSATNDTGGFSRMWFEPDQMTLQRYVDPTSGVATINFQKSTVTLLTESYLQGQPSDAAAQAFVDNFKANYESFAARSFPVIDPTVPPSDPTYPHVIQVPIFALLKQVMQAVSVARFFHDNNIPLDMSWMSNYQPPTIYTAKSVPTAENQGTTGNQILIYGGVQIVTPNNYIPSDTGSGAQSIGQSIVGSRPNSTTTPTQDLKQQAWTAAGLSAVATSLTSDSQSGNVSLSEHDLSFASPGALALSFTRYYQSSYTGMSSMGPGWRYPRYSLQFSNPSWFDQNHYMKDGSGDALATDGNSDTRLRSGTVRLLDSETGVQLDFSSSLAVNYSTDGLGNPVVTITGLTTNAVPTFTAGQHQNGAALAQVMDATKGYTVTMPDGSFMMFDSNGNILQTTDRHNYSQFYGYDSLGRLSTITDSTVPTPQVIALAYDSSSSLLTSATGPNSVGMTFHYDSSGRLSAVVHAQSNVAVAQYTYNSSDQLVDVTRIDGTKPLTTLADLKGRTTAKTNSRGNSLAWSYFKNQTDGSKVSSAFDSNAGVGTWETGADSLGRLTYTKDAMNNYTLYGYNGNSMAPTSVQSPTPSDLNASGSRPAIKIIRNTLGLPTSITDPAIPGGQPVQVSYNSANFIQHVSDTGGRSTDLLYTTSNNLQTVRTHHNNQNLDVTFGYQSEFLHTVADPMNHTWTYGRDGLGRVTSATDPTGVAKTYDYDSYGRLWKIHDPRLSSAVVYSYDSLNRVTSIATPAGTQTFTYDPTHQWLHGQTSTAADGQTTSIQYTYNNQTGDVTSAATTYQVDPIAGGSTQTVTTNYGYSPYGYLQSITPPSADSINYTVNSLGQIVGTSLQTAGPSIVANSASSGVWTNQSNQTFSWTPTPNGSLTVTGYSYAEDTSALMTVNTTSATAPWNNVTDGQHTFRVRTQYSNGSWSAESIFNLWIDSTQPTITASATPNPLPLGNVSVTVSANIIDPISDWIDNLITTAGASNPGTAINGTNLGGNMSLFSTVDDVDGLYTRNRNIWTGSLDLSGVSIYRNDGTFASSATLITPADAVVANHAAPSVGSVLTFVDNNNVVYKATVSAVGNAFGDLSIAHLNWSGTTPTSLKIYRVLPGNYQQALPSYDVSNFPIIGINQFRQVFCQDAGATPFSSGTFNHGLSTETNRVPFTLSIIGGDSSYPLFEAINGEPVLLGANFSATSAPSIADNIPAINAVLAGFSGDTYSVSTYSTANSAVISGSGITGFPLLRWCLSSDSSRNWSSYAPMTGGSGQPWISSFSENGASGQTLYYQIQAQDTAGNIGNFTGSVALNYSSTPSLDFGNTAIAPLYLSLIDGYLYGETSQGGRYGYGTVFRVNKDGSSSQVIYSFQGPDGATPVGGLVEDSAGNLWGGTSAGGSQNKGTLFKLTKAGALVTYANEGTTNRLCLASDGNFYGFMGTDAFSDGAFKMTPQGIITKFNGVGLSSSFVEANDGNLYAMGGYSIVKMTKSGSESTFFSSFNGYSPSALIQGSDGNFYGTIQTGGNTLPGIGCGALFKVTPSGTATFLYSFPAGPLPDYPIGALVQGSDGSFYATCSDTAPFGFGAQGVPGQGGIIKMLPSTAINLNFSFAGGYYGNHPMSGLIADGSGILYGTTLSTVYSFTSSGQLTTLMVFNQSPVITSQPNAQTVPVAFPTSFAANIIGTPYLSYRWQREPNGSSTWSDLTEGSIYSGSTDSTITINSPTLSMNGDQFRYVVTNQYGAITSSPATLNVLPSVFTVQPISQTVKKGAGVTFSAAVTGTGPYTYQWQKNGVNISGANSASYSIATTTDADAGSYSVIVTGQYGTVTSSVATLAYLEPGVDTPTMDQWFLVSMGCLLFLFAIQPKRRIAR